MTYPLPHHKTGIVYSPAYKLHTPTPWHPESPSRCGAIMRGIESAVPADRRTLIEPRKAEESDILLCHTGPYLEIVKRDVKAGARVLSTGDTEISGKSFETALLAAGGVLEAVDSVIARRVSNAFCAVRPPGHHATRNRGMGFCIFNNAAIGARYARKKHGVEKVMIADWDVHHGNGTQDIFYEDESVFYFSVHQWPQYPGTGAAAETGAGRGKGTTLNCPLGAGSGGSEIIRIFNEKLVPAAEEFRPDFIFVSVGFDCLKRDPIGGFVLDEKDFAELTRIVLKTAETHCGGRLISVLEGGYDLEAMASAAGRHVAAMAGL
ncbi:MAG: histone deacetylase [Kiritimatiellia bacterium]